jgi:hypothetical protein
MEAPVVPSRWRERRQRLDKGCLDKGCLDRAFQGMWILVFEQHPIALKQEFPVWPRFLGPGRRGKCIP